MTWANIQARFCLCIRIARTRRRVTRNKIPIVPVGVRNGFRAAMKEGQEEETRDKETSCREACRYHIYSAQILHFPFLRSPQSLRRDG